MRKKKKIKVKYRSFIVVFIFIVCIVFLMKKSFSEEIKIDFSKLSKKEALSLCEINKLECNFIYQDDLISKDMVLEYFLTDNQYTIILSSGHVSKELLLENKVNELGKVPIMMYHGIINTETTSYIGGNVDRDGYNRTSKAFREDLEFYYQKGYRMIRLIDYVNGDIDVSLGLSPIILTFDDGNQNNFNVLGKDENNNLIIDPDCAVGILEEFKKKYPDYNVTATFFVMDGLFNQSLYNEDILNWLVDNGYDIGNHTTTHPDFTKITTQKTQEVVGKMYQKLDKILKDKYIKIVALPFGSPYNKNHDNFSYILSGNYLDYEYETISALRVGWEPELSPYDKNFDPTFLKRCRAYDNNGLEFDIQMVFKNLEKNRFISDGTKDFITVKESDQNKIMKDLSKEIITY